MVLFNNDLLYFQAKTNITYGSEVTEITESEISNRRLLDTMFFQKEIDKCFNTNDFIKVLEATLFIWKGDKIEWLNYTYKNISPPRAIYDFKKDRIFIATWNEWFKSQYPKNERKVRMDKNKGLIWTGNEEIELKRLYRKLNGRFILSGTNEQLFIGVLSGKIFNPEQPIKWIAQTKLLAYFLNSVFTQRGWQTIIDKNKYFLSSEGKIITRRNIASSLNQTKGLEQLKEYKEIDNIIKEIKNP